MAIHAKPGERFDKSGRANKKDFFDYKLFDKSVCQSFYAYVHGGHAKKYIKYRQDNVINGNFEKIDKRGGCHNFKPLE